MGRASQEFDRQLFTLKLSELSRQMQIESVKSDRAAARQGGGSVLIRIVDGQLAVLSKWLEGVDRICREVWQTQGETITTEFVREILVPNAMTLIGVRVGVTKSCVNLSAARTNKDPHAALGDLASKAARLKSEIANRYEIEARELEYKKPPGARGRSQSELHEPRSIRGLIEDAERDTALWLQANPSAEERAHVLGMQERLADLDRIIKRRVERRGSPEDGRQWSETVREVLSLLEKAREVRGNIVGKRLARLTGRLPQELPESKLRLVTQSAAPPKARSGTGGWTPRQPSSW